MQWMSRRAAVAGIALLALLPLSCSSLTPWKNEKIGNEVNLAFTLERNLIVFQTLRLDGRDGRFLLGSAAPRTVVDEAFPLATSRRHAIRLGERQSSAVSPARSPLGGVADAIIGADAWHDRAITIDYKVGLVTWQKDGIHPAQMTLYRYEAEPMIQVTVDGRETAVIVDTASPDTLVLPRREHGRGSVRVAVANHDFGDVDVQYANIAHPRIGNRLLAHFLVSIDYGKRTVGLWKDPRL